MANKQTPPPDLSGLQELMGSSQDAQAKLKALQEILKQANKAKEGGIPSGHGAGGGHPQGPVPGGRSSYDAQPPSEGLGVPQHDTSGADSGSSARKNDGGAAAPVRLVNKTYYIYVDRKGTQHVVEGLDRIPKRYRKKAKQFVMTHTTTMEEPKSSTDATPGMMDRVTQISEQLLRSVKQGQSTQSTTAYVPQGATGRGSLDPASALMSNLTLPAATLVVAGALALVMAFAFKGARKILLKVAIMVLLVGGLAVGYLQLISSQTGLAKDGKIVTPAQVVQDARDAADLMQKSMEDQAKALDALEYE